MSRGEAAKAKIEKETGIEGVAQVWQLDLGSYDSVKEFAKKVQALDRVDAVVENASIALEKYTQNEGLETTLTVNVLSTILLASMVLPKLEQMAKTFDVLPHLAVVGSGTAFYVPGLLEKIDGDIFEVLDKDLTLKDR